MSKTLANTIVPNDISSLLIIDCDSSGSGGTDVTQFLIDYSVLYPKLWADDTGRNLAGSMKATLIGIYTKLQMELKSKIDATNLMTILSSLNKDAVYCKYFDIATQQMQVERFYFGDLEAKLISMQLNKFKFNTISIIAFDKREIGNA